MADGFVSQREQRWEYVTECVEHIEQHNCALGCKRGAPGTEWPGGTCGVLALVIIEEPTTDLHDDGTVVHCLAREPIR